jgi:hypothetical protein
MSGIPVRPLLSWTVHCPVCGVDCSTAGHPHRPGNGCTHRPSFLEQIPVAEVREEIADLLSRYPIFAHHGGRNGKDDSSR